MEMERANNASEIAMQQQEKASNSQLLCEQRVSSLEEALDAAKDRHSESRSKVAELQTTVIELQEKGRMFDDVAAQKNTLDDEVIRLRSVIEQKQKEADSFAKKDKDERSKLKDLERTVQTLEMDKTFLEKEKCILTERTERSDECNNKYNHSLRDAVVKSDNLMMQLAEANLSSKSECDKRITREVQRIRSESEKELKSYRNQVEAAFERETKMLREAKTEVVAHCERANREVQRLRHSLEQLTSEKDAKNVELDRSLCDCQSDLKVKCIESSRIHLANEKLEEDLRGCRTELQMITDQVEVHKAEFKNLEKDSIYERKRLTNEIRRKEEQLEMYY